MPRPALTKRTAHDAQSEAERFELRDGKVKGLRLMVYPSGQKAWSLRYRNGKGEARRFVIGDYSEEEGGLGLDEARRIAAGKMLEVAEGADPSAKRRETRRAGTTVKAVWEEYRDSHLKQRRDATAKAAATLFNNDVLPKWGKLEITTIRRRDVMNLLDGMRSEPAKANKAKARLNHFFGFAVEREIIDASPVSFVKRPHKPKSRTRVLTPAELRAVWLACDQVGNFGRMVRLLILTLARRTEVAEMKWDELSDSLWTIPEERSKNGIALDIHRTEAFNAVLASVPVVDNGCEYVFEGRHHCKPLGGFSDLKAKLDAITGDAVAPYTLHDLRRSGATMMQHLKIRKEVIDACQNHKMQGVSATYLRYGYADEKREAFEKLAAKVLRIVSDVPIVAAPALTNEDAPALTAV